jgi:hypothetical protein
MLVDDPFYYGSLPGIRQDHTPHFVSDPAIGRTGI